jgi:hypothetical protein
MPTFETPEPISVSVELVAGRARLIASERADTVVEVRPGGGRDADIQAAEETRVDFEDGRLSIKTPKPRGFFGKGGWVELTIELPAGSRVTGKAASADLHCAGPMGECRLRTGYGDIQVEQAAAVQLHTSYGDITVDRVAGHCEATGSGAVRFGEIEGTAVIKNLNGDIRVGDATGELRLNTANGNVYVERAHASVGVKTANGDVRIGEVARDSVVLDTACGELEIGIRKGTAAWLDVRSHYGTVHNSLAAADGPEPTDDKVKVRAHTAYGDIVIRRA